MIKLDFEIADRITVISLREHYNILKKELDAIDILEVPTEVQAKQYANDLRILKSLKIVLGYFGEQV